MMTCPKTPDARKGRVLAAVLLLLGMSQMMGDLMEMPWLKGLAAALVASPAPKVFSSVQGLETFSTAFHLSFTDPQGRPHTLPLDRHTYAKLDGPYNRRNVWGAILSYGPVLATTPLTAPMFHHTARWGLCDKAPILRELDLDPEKVQDITIHYTPRPGSQTDLPLSLAPRCHS